MIPPCLAASRPGSALLSQPQLLLFVLVALVWIFKAIQRAVAGSASPPRPGGQAGRAGPDIEDEDRARRVREEILRKVTERQLGRGAAPAARAERRPARSRPVIPELAAYGAGVQPGEGEAARVSRAEPAQPAGAGSIAGSVFTPGPSRGSHWLDTLRTRDGVRGAVLAREILGPPLALRQWRYSPLGE
jgi:hypothetical protein